MREIYNRFLPGRSALAALTLAMLALYALSGALDFVRVRLMARTAHRLDARLSARVFAAVQANLAAAARSDGLQPLRDLDQVRSFLASPGPTALLDMPWMPLYLVVIFLMHPMLGVQAASGAGLLVLLKLLAERHTALPMRAAMRCAGTRWALAASARRHAETSRAMGTSCTAGPASMQIISRPSARPRGRSTRSPRRSRRRGRSCSPPWWGLAPISSSTVRARRAS
jgi:ABC-type protease/lipase transport system fused ATPase/permease subunit